MIGGAVFRPEIAQLAGLARHQRQIESCDLLPDVREAAEGVFPVLDVLDIVTHLFDLVIQIRCFLIQFFDLSRIMDPETDHNERKNDCRQDHCHNYRSTGFLPGLPYSVR